MDRIKNLLAKGSLDICHHINDLFLDSLSINKNIFVAFAQNFFTPMVSRGN